MTGYIYFHVNKLNNKIYVGQTNSIKMRWASNGVKYKSCKKFYHAIEKYGWDNFHHFYFEFRNTTYDKLNEIEQYWIKRLDTMKSGYNLTSGGSNWKPSSRTVNIRKEKTSKPVNQYSKNGIFIKQWESVRSVGYANVAYHSSVSACAKGKIKSAGGYVWRYLGDSFAKTFKNSVNYNVNSNLINNAKKVDYYSKDGLYVGSFNSMSDASRSLGLDVSGISKSCRKKVKVVGGYVWRYEGEDF